MTRCSGGIGPRFDGNSIILQNTKDIDNNIYYFVGESIYKFVTIAPIIYYTSPVGHNDVLYPWAQDSNGNIYLMTEYVRIEEILSPRHRRREKNNFDPYKIYYDMNKLEKRYHCHEMQF